MSERIHNLFRQRSDAGFSMVELLTAMALTLLMFALTFTLVQQLDNTADVVGSMADVNENLRAAVNMMSRDLSTAGQNIPVGGIPLPYGGTGTTMIKRPYPANTNLPTPLTGTTTLSMPVLIAGYQLGNSQGTISTDVVSMIGVNQTSPFNPTTVNTTTSPPTFTSASATITVSTTAAGSVSPGQLIMLSNGLSQCLLAVSSANTTTGVITFTNGDTTNDLMGVNQFPTVSATTGNITSGPQTGTIYALESFNSTSKTFSWPGALTAYPISVVTYYLDTTTPEKNLTRLTSVGTSGCVAPAVTCTNVVALGIDVIQFLYNLYPAATSGGVVTATSDPTGYPWPTSTDTGNSPNHIRKVLIYIIGETNHRNFANSQWYSKEIKTAVTIQNLDFYNQFGTGSSTTQMTQN